MDEFITNAALETLAKGKDRAYVSESQKMARELIQRRAGWDPFLQPVQGEINIRITPEDLQHADWGNSAAFADMDTGELLFYRGGNGRYIVYKVGPR